MAEITFNFHLYKIGSLYHMVESLSGFHHSYRDYANEYWLKQTGPLTPSEQESLEKFRKVVANYPFGHEKYLGKFLETKPKSKALKKLKENIKSEEYEIIKEVLEFFEPRFEKIWQEQAKSLNAWKALLERNIAKHKKEILDEISSFLPTKPILKDINVYLLISGGPESCIGGGANLGPQRITLEVGIISKRHLNRVLTVFWHEIFHAIAGTSFTNDILSYLSGYLKKNPLPKKVLNIEPGKDPLGILNEGVTKVFETHISDKYYDYELRKRAQENMISLKKRRRKLASMNYFLILNDGLDLLRSYLEDSRKLDKKFLDALVKLHENFAEELKR